jgi:hypothetical protein
MQDCVKSSEQLKKLKLTATGFKSNDEFCKSGWIYRSVIDTFELKDADDKRRKCKAYAAFKISLALESSDKDDAFFPNVSVLIAWLANKSCWMQWEIEEFEMDDDYLTDCTDDELPWKKQKTGYWVCEEDSNIAVAFSVPLADLASEDDVKQLVIDPFCELAKQLQDNKFVMD